MLFVFLPHHPRSTIHPTLLSFLPFFSPAGCWICIFCGLYTMTRRENSMAKIAGFIATRSVPFPCMASRRGQREKARIPGIRYSPPSLSPRCLKGHFWLADPPAHSLTNHDDVFAITDNGRYKNERDRREVVVWLVRVCHKNQQLHRGES